MKCEIFIYDQKQILQSNLLGLEKILFLAIAALVKSKKSGATSLFILLLFPFMVLSNC